MVSTLIVGGIFIVIMYFAIKKSLSDLKKGKCAGCSGCNSSKKPIQPTIIDIKF